jgi:hypothetical protein
LAPTSADATLDFALSASMSAVAACRSPSSSARSVFSSREATRNDTRPRRAPTGHAQEAARRGLGVDGDDRAGAAGARSPDPNSTLMKTPVMPPRMVAAISLGFISTYGKDLVDAAEELMMAAPAPRPGDALPKTMYANNNPRPGPGWPRAGTGRICRSQRLGGAQRGQHAVVDGVVEEQHLGRLDEQRGQRQQVVVHQEVDGVARHG